MYHLFLYDQYYPGGGLNDYCGEFSSVENALEYAKQSTNDYYQVVTSDFVAVQRGCVNEL